MNDSVECLLRAIALETADVVFSAGPGLSSAELEPVIFTALYEAYLGTFAIWKQSVELARREPELE
jgi:hypothetical protein